MKPEDVKALYDQSYAEDYDETFLHRDIHRSDTAFETGILAEALKRADSWFDVGCGTGYFLSQFPGRRRAGADLSEAMLAKARAVNPDADFYVHDFRVPRPEWRGAWQLVSSMWYAHAYVDTLDEFDLFLTNLSDWTASEGALFLPYVDLGDLWGRVLPYDVPSAFAPSKVLLKGLIWSYEHLGKSHHNMIAPHADYIRQSLERRFRQVRTIDYPPAMPGWTMVRRAFMAEGRIVDGG